jgi:hypothetical protein
MTVRRVMTSLGLGAMGAALPVAVASMLPGSKAHEFWAVLLAVAGTIYIGSALTDGRWRAIAVEAGVGLVFVAGALAGLWGSPGWLVVGWGLHAFWDLAHHLPAVEGGCAHLAVETYPLLCLSFDVVVAAFTALRFL